MCKNLQIFLIFTDFSVQTNAYTSSKNRRILKNSGYINYMSLIQTKMEYKTVQRDKLVVTPLDSYEAGCLKVNNSNSLMKRTILHLITTFLVILCWKTIRKIRIKLNKTFFSSLSFIIVNSFIFVTNMC